MFCCSEPACVHVRGTYWSNKGGRLCQEDVRTLRKRVLRNCIGKGDGFTERAMDALFTLLQARIRLLALANA